jgi:hypothetical protein
MEGVGLNVGDASEEREVGGRKESYIPIMPSFYSSG